MKKLYEKFIRRISRRFWNHTVHHIILEAMEKNILNSHQGHAILGAWNANCFPENGHRSFLHEGGETPRTLDVCPSCAGNGFMKIGVYAETCSACNGAGTRQ
jgi:hypothetical protein